MNRDILAALEAFSGLRVAVVGDPMLDVYISGASHRMSPEAPAPVVDVERRIACPGGAANVAANVAALGADVRLIGVTGADPQAVELRALLRDAGVDIGGLVADPDRDTLEKVRVVAAGHLLARLDRGTRTSTGRATEVQVAAYLADAATGADIVLVSDYGYGTTEGPVLAALGRACGAGVPVGVDAKDLRRYGRLGVLLAKPNYAQALDLLPAAGSRDGAGRAGHVAHHAGELLLATGAAVVAVTLDAGGALIIERDGGTHRTSSTPANGSCAGAGDTFLAALAMALVAGCPAGRAGELAAAAAGIVVGKEYTSTCPAAELRARFAPVAKVVRDRQALAERVTAARHDGRSIVFTNGCFDIVHSGHVRHLEQARALGDLLVVGVNTDASVRRLKGLSRPFVGLDDRLDTLAGLSSVDVVVPFEEDTPAALIRALRPDVYVKGGDYDRATLPEAPLVEALGGRVEILPHFDGLSTTALIDRMHRQVIASLQPRKERAS